jgi:hypothetical protein
MGLMKLLATVLGGLIGGVAGYLAGAHVSCDWLYPNSIMCGIAGVFVTGPVGVVGGAVAGRWLSRRGAVTRRL